jgi:hypothetical protein
VINSGLDTPDTLTVMRIFEHPACSRRLRPGQPTEFCYEHGGREPENVERPGNPASRTKRVPRPRGQRHVY